MDDNCLNILIVEDNPGDLRLVREFLGESSAPVFKTAHAGRLCEALETLAKGSFDVVLLDLDLPDSSGLGALEKISAAKAEIPVIVLTGQSDETLGFEALRKSAGDYLVKGQINTHLLTRSIRYAIERRKKEKELGVLNRALKAHSDSSQAMLRATGEAEYLEKVCRIIMEYCGHSMVWVGFAENDKNKAIRPVAQAGFEDGYLKTLNVTWADTGLGRGPTGTAIRTGKPGGCRNMLTDPAFAPWRAEALKRGYASSLALPLKADGGTFGALTIYSRKTDAFSERETALLVEIADDLAFGTMAIRLRLEREKVDEILRRDNETFEKQVRERSRELLYAQQELEKAKRLSDIGTLAAIVAHELRNPLAAISMAASNIRRKAGNPLLDRNLDNIDKKVTESNRIISNLLFYSRIRMPQFDTVDISAILEECVDVAESASSLKVPVRMDLGISKNTLIKADPLQMKEVFSNILNNAFDAVSSRPRGKIQVRAAENGGFINIRVEDTGVGIDKETLGKIFEPFFTTKAKGTGLGLYVCQQIINLHGGAITVESEPGKGTVFSVNLPRGPENGEKKNTDH
ncbi:MAG: hypothetical protein A2X34_04615 [Elusimicrobia bacterium GWC2_51_8]|nr:MAG: hypothetical protein A2X33_00420 [Elusimicrobia bacterium GWA2_51_34]OGR63645.1 MAG: hypothetical protein A2X34_04615 [Elusimicrobia bacterium GWC2_51_8]HAF96334.1 hypothetical protein [Elusimicrobiota bacterium]HCE98520.1 hypothetical protein [Elusimicrobiota bacterium]